MAKHFFFYINNVYHFLPRVFPFGSIAIQIWDKLIHCYLFYSITIEICSSLLEFIYLLIWYYRIIWEVQYWHFRSSHWRCSGKISVLRNRCFQNGQVKFAVKTSEKKNNERIHFNKAVACNFTKNGVLHRYFSRDLNANFRVPVLQNNYFLLAAALINCAFTAPTIFGFIIDFFDFSLSEICKSGNNRKLMAPSSRAPSINNVPSHGQGG